VCVIKLEETTGKACTHKASARIQDSESDKVCYRGHSFANTERTFILSVEIKEQIKSETVVMVKEVISMRSSNHFIPVISQWNIYKTN